MRNPGRKTIYGILCIALSGAILYFLPHGFMDDFESIPTLATAMALFMLAVSGLYLLFSGSYRAVRMKSLLAGKGVIARWHVPPDVWTRFRAIRLKDTGVAVPNLRGLGFIARRTTFLPTKAARRSAPSGIRSGAKGGAEVDPCIRR